MLDAPYFLQLMIGPGVPIPVPREVLDALVSVEVTSNTESASVFQLTFTLSTRSPLHTLFLVAGGAGIPMIRVVIIVVTRGGTEVLMDGVMTHHQVSGGDAGGHATLTITGEDLSKVMTYLPFDGLPYPAMPPNIRVLTILAKYAVLGIVPLVIPPLIMDIALPTEQIDRQNGNDLDYIRCLADGVGYEFYVDPGPLPLQSTAYWGPSIRVGAPQPALNINMDSETNVESMDFKFDPEEPVLPVVMIYPKMLKVGIPIPIPAVNPLAPPMGLVPPIPKKVEIDRESARKNPGVALLAAFSRAARTADAAQVTGTLNVARYGRILKSRRTVGVRGAGLAFDGLYYVRSVKHSIQRGEYKQDFTLVRNGLISTLPRVPA
jgi:hypothetical protein